jgi:diguanylate cyclase (GGDEF)-like protein
MPTNFEPSKADTEKRAAAEPPPASTVPLAEETQVASALTRVAATGTAYLVNIYPTGPGMGARYRIDQKSLFLGRDDASDIPVEDPSASRRHAEIRPTQNSHYVIDLQSTNGTFVNDRPVSITKLRDGDYLRIGNRIFRYLASGNIEAEYHEEIYRMTILDGLTGIHNKRALLEFLEAELSRSSRHQRPLSLILFDIDHFKAINDNLGHLGGDYVLRDLAGCLKITVSKEQCFARYGGEEFALALPEVQHDEAVQTAEELRARIENYPFRFDGHAVRVTISLGVVTTVGDERLAPVDLIRLADERLYRAKDLGRNRVVG